MSFLLEVIRDALSALVDGIGGDLWAVVLLTTWVALLATGLAVVIGVPIGAAVGLQEFRGKRLVTVAINTGMGMPPVLAGLVLLLVLWRDGPLGSWNLLFTPAAMVIAQTLLAIPIVAGLTAASLRALPNAAHEQLVALKLSWLQRSRVGIREVLPGVAGAVAAAFGRVISEVGAVLIVGGNIRGETRVLTTAIVQESRQAQFDAALAFGIVLFLLALAVNGVVTWLQFRESPT